MTKLINITRRLLPAALIAAVSVSVTAQSYYDDDIYYVAPKKKADQKQTTTAKTANSASSQYVASGASAHDFAPADSYTTTSSSMLNVDVDTYNRRGQFLVSDSIVATEDANGDFLYTQRIERFHNPDIVAGSNDEELRDVYAYAMQQPQNINIYVIDNDPWSWYGPSWSWRYGNPWYWNTWGPSWNWSLGFYDPYWAWGPSWNWSWGWGPSWGPGWSHGWGHGWGPGWGPSWSGPGMAWNRPSTPSGSSRPHRPVGTGAVMTHRPGSYSQPSTTARPGNMGQSQYNNAGQSAAAGTRPGNYTPSTSGSNGSSSSAVAPTTTGGRGRAAMNQSTNSNSTRNTYNNYNSNNNNYRQSSNSSSGGYHSSGSGFSRGSSGTHSSGGGAGRGSSGGGGGRGRR